MNNLKTDDFDFELDESLIAQFPLKDRSSSKLLIVNRENFDLEHKNFKNIVDYIKKDDVLVINDTATTEIYTLSLHDALPIYCVINNIFKIFMF